MSSGKKSPAKTAAVADPNAPRPRPRRIFKAEGEDGLYSQNWWPVCRSDEVKPGQVIGRDFLGGKIAIYRTEAGEPRVVGGYCVHMGADLSFGAVKGDELVCPFHKWRFGAGGRCVATGIGDPPPGKASLFNYPVTERWGMVFAFNGVEPLFDIVALQRPEDQLIMRHVPVDITECDAFMLTANTFDWSHFGILHDFYGDPDLPEPEIEWSDYSCGFTFRGKHWLGERVVYDLTICGNNIYMQQGTLQLHDREQWYCMLLPIGQSRPLKSTPTMIVATERGDGSPEALTRANYLLERLVHMELVFVDQDKEILNNIHFGPGYMTPSDRPFFQFMDYLDRFPRANPGMHYLR
jgi:phenylpropionate dioxygenase-like ring-hydroxylating dioxygenase large terminal subunit